MYSPDAVPPPRMGDTVPFPSNRRGSPFNGSPYDPMAGTMPLPGGTALPLVPGMPGAPLRPLDPALVNREILRTNELRDRYQ